DHGRAAGADADAVFRTRSGEPARTPVAGGGRTKRGLRTRFTEQETQARTRPEPAWVARPAATRGRGAGSALRRPDCRSRSQGGFRGSELLHPLVPPPHRADSQRVASAVGSIVDGSHAARRQTGRSPARRSEI